MPSNDEVMRLIIETIGAQGVEDLRRKLAELPNEMGRVAAAFGRGEIDAEEFDRELKRLRESHIQLTRTIQDFDRATGGATNKMAGFGQSALQSGRAIQDFAQGGIGGVLNNIEGLAMALGGGPGLAGVLTLVGVGLLTVGPQLKEFIASFKSKDAENFRGSLERLKAELKGLEEKPAKVAIDFRDIDIATKKIDELQQAQNNFNKLGRGQDPFEKESGQQVEEIFSTLGMADSEAVKNKLKAQEYNAIRAADGIIQGLAKIQEESERAIATAKAQRAGATSPAEIRLAEQTIKDEQQKIADAKAAAQDQERKIQEQAEQDVGRIFGGATRGDVRQQRELAKRLRGIKRPDLAGSVEASSPAEMQAYEESEKEHERGIEQMKADRDIRLARQRKAQADQRKVQAEREKAGQAAERALAADPMAKVREAENFERFGPELMGLDANAAALAAQNAREVREQRVAKDRRANQLEAPPTPKQQRRAQAEFQEGRLARQIFQQGGGQFTPEQAQDIAKRSVELQQQGVGANQATLAAMGEALQTMVQLANQMRQQQAWAMQMGGQFGQMRQQMQMPGPTNLNMGAP